MIGDVAQIWNLFQFGFDAIGVFAGVGQIRADDGDFDRSRRSEAHHFAHDIARLETERDLIGSGFCRGGRQALLFKQAPPTTV